jgi:hypothetical protein
MITIATEVLGTATSIKVITVISQMAVKRKTIMKVTTITITYSVPLKS